MCWTGSLVPPRASGRKVSQRREKEQTRLSLLPPRSSGHKVRSCLVGLIDMRLLNSYLTPTSDRYKRKIWGFITPHPAIPPFFKYFASYPPCWVLENWSACLRFCVFLNSPNKGMTAWLWFSDFFKFLFLFLWNPFCSLMAPALPFPFLSASFCQSHHSFLASFQHLILCRCTFMFLNSQNTG